MELMLTLYVRFFLFSGTCFGPKFWIWFNVFWKNSIDFRGFIIQILLLLLE